MSTYLSVQSTAVAVIAFLGGVIVTLVSSWLARRNEFGKWVRDERLKVYSEYLGHARDLPLHFSTYEQIKDQIEQRGDPDGEIVDILNKLLEGIARSYSKVTLLASQPVLSSANDVFAIIEEFVTAKRTGSHKDYAHLGKAVNQFREAARKELGVR